MWVPVRAQVQVGPRLGAFAGVVCGCALMGTSLGAFNRTVLAFEGWPAGAGAAGAMQPLALPAPPAPPDVLPALRGGAKRTAGSPAPAPRAPQPGDEAGRRHAAAGQLRHHAPDGVPPQVRPRPLPHASAPSTPAPVPAPAPAPAAVVATAAPAAPVVAPQPAPPPVVAPRHHPRGPHGGHGHGPKRPVLAAPASAPQAAPPPQTATPAAAAPEGDAPAGAAGAGPRGHAYGRADDAGNARGHRR